MLTAYKITLIVIMIIGSIGVVGEKKNLKQQQHMLALTIAAMISFIISYLYL